LTISVPECTIRQCLNPDLTRLFITNHVCRYIHPGVFSIASLFWACLLIGNPLVAEPLQVNLTSDTNYIQNNTTTKGVFKRTIAQKHNITFTGESSSTPHTNVSNKLQLEYLWNLTDRLTFKSQTTNTFDSSTQTSVVHKIDLQYRRPINSFDSTVRLGYKKREGANVLSEAVLTLSKIVPFRGKRLFKLTANAKWNQTESSTGTTHQQESKLIVNKDWNLKNKRLIKLTGIVGWKQTLTSGLKPVDGMGGMLDLQLILNPDLKVKMTHAVGDEFDAELTKITGEYTWNIASGEYYFEAVADNKNKKYLNLSARYFW